MSPEYRISYADLSAISGSLHTINSNVRELYAEVDQQFGYLNRKTENLGEELQRLISSFADYVEEDRKHKNLQLAETRIGNIRQEIQSRFGFYSEIRRMATGILQGTDHGLVGEDTIRFFTEEAMMKAPGYWLAPALVTVAAWLRNDRSVADRGLRESLRRDDYKSTLFFMLLMRRVGRQTASLRWLERYFMHQNAHKLSREVLIILEAISSGVFPPASRQLLMSVVSGWIQSLTTDSKFVDEQKNQWNQFFRSKRPSIDESEFPFLISFATNWNEWENSLMDVRSNKEILNHFLSIINGSREIGSLVQQLDDILSMLVTNFDDEELPFQEQLRRNELIVQFHGDIDAASEVLKAETRIFDEEVDFLQILTNAAFNPEEAGVSRQTQVMAVSISQPWILDSFETYSARNRMNKPAEIKLRIEGWFGVSTDGGNDQQLQESLHKYHKSILKVELGKLPFPWLLTLIGLILVGYGIYRLDVLGLILLAVGGVMASISLFNWFRSRQQLKAKQAEQEATHLTNIRASLAEVVDYHRSWQEADLETESVRSFLKNIQPENFASISKESSRNIVYEGQK